MSHPSRFRFASIALGFLVLAAPAQDGIRFAAAPMLADSPSWIAAPAADAALVLGSKPLTAPPRGVVDGDTIRVDDLKESLRLVGLDTEETFKDKGLKALAARDWAEYLRTVMSGHTPERPPKYGSPMGEAAKDFAARFFDGVRTVRLEYDAPGRRIDYYGRHLVLVLVEREERLVNFNVEVVRQGLSPYFVKYGRSARFHPAFLAAEKEARDAKRGIWGDPPAHRCYPDYGARLAWWRERDRALEKIAERRAAGETILLLGDDATWDRLLAAEGKEVTVAGTPGAVQKRGDTALIALGHQAGKDFMIAGPAADIAAHALAGQEGNIVLVSGTVSLYNGRPQFRLDAIKDWSRP